MTGGGVPIRKLMRDADRIGRFRLPYRGTGQAYARMTEVWIPAFAGMTTRGLHWIPNQVGNDRKSQNDR